MISETELAARRHTMTLRERVEARRALDQAAGITYSPISDETAGRIITLLAPTA
ncbi:hypothetical protein [Nocardia farcinica]